ncbi:Repeat domain-containing protein [Saccharopolyspora antimicrobica]|uniref:Repeat domain-containing protein n=1 Tax=Saccharopolyspora antimicrobica TaxID=455193 RepID=A0A1I4VT97_9PSEU|nr:CRTAC1 family protein [Saccharopolyspora antimicrobica]RKT87221.1 VCBS repeat protein [Saccharopolyspora antimicrobica]SFN04392.1 Repeat domain-containing protein [Saccharopolyspora antimicrobica]
MKSAAGWLRRQLTGVVALILMAAVFIVAQPSTPSAADTTSLAGNYAFSPKSIAMPSGFPQQEIRAVNKDYKHIDAWISSVGAAIAMNDVDGDGLPNDLCVTDPRIDQVVVTPAPDAKADRYAPFALSHSLPMNEHIAPMGCLAGDFNEDGRTDLMVYYWGRTPVLFLARTDATALNNAAFAPTELVPGVSGPVYDGPQWNSNAVAFDDFDGDGHGDLLITNYFPHGPVLNDQVSGGVAMNDSMSAAYNGGEDYFFRWTGGTSGIRPTASYERVDDALPTDVSKGWELAAAANDLDGDGLPELYLANDFGPDRLLYNQSTPGELKFSLVEDVRSPVVPKSKQVGLDSFKGMGVDFGDLDGDGLYDMFVSNITTSWGIQESNFQFMNTARDHADLRDKLAEGKPPFTDTSAPAGTAWSGWGWDVKMGDFDNDGRQEIAQSTGFVKGQTDRWPQLQELATANDELLSNPLSWPRVNHGDDIGGTQRLAFYSPIGDGAYANLAGELGLDVPVPTRGIATGDTDGDGKLDFAVARQWDQPVFYQNQAPAPGSFLGLRLTHDSPSADGATPAAGSPVVGAQVTVTTPDGRKLLGRVDGGSGHSGKRSNDVHIGLGDGVTGPVQVHLKWRDRTGRLHEQELKLTPGWHSLQLGEQAKEK